MLIVIRPISKFSITMNESVNILVLELNVINWLNSGRKKLITYGDNLTEDNA